MDKLTGKLVRLLRTMHSRIAPADRRYWLGVTRAIPATHQEREQEYEQLKIEYREWRQKVSL